jgi:hypothetical protein
MANITHPHSLPISPAQPTPAARSGRRTLAWIAGGLVAAAAIVVVGAALLFAGIVTAIKSHDSYQLTERYVAAHPVVQAQIGEPVEFASFPMGQTTTNGSSGNSDWTVSLSGPKGSGKAQVVSVRDARGWRVHQAILVTPRGNYDLSPGE